MRADEVYKIFLDWKDNEFEHFRKLIEKRTFWMLTTVVGALVGIIITLVAVLVQ